MNPTEQAKLGEKILALPVVARSYTDHTGLGQYGFFLRAEGKRENTSVAEFEAKKKKLKAIPSPSAKPPFSDLSTPSMDMAATAADNELSMELDSNSDLEENFEFLARLREDDKAMRDEN